MDKYLVGGAVRDELLGIRSKDLDYTVVLSSEEISEAAILRMSPFRYMADKLASEGYQIFVETPDYATVRAQTPDRKETADFVLAREEGPYSDGRRPDWTKPGTLLMDLQRRDFTVNAIAKDADGNLIDPFDGQGDILIKRIVAVGDPVDRLTEDALRAVRALRFSVTKGFRIEDSLSFAMEYEPVLDAIVNKISDERIREELSKMFRYDTIGSLIIINQYPALRDAMFAGDVSLDATMKTKGRGK